MTTRPIKDPIRPRGCGECGEFRDCGGMEGQLNLEAGCFGHCGPLCLAAGCDLACPYNEEDYVLKYMEVGGPNYWPPVALKAPDVVMPRYMPVIRHGFGRCREFAGTEGYAALTLYEILQNCGHLRGGPTRHGARAADELRIRFKLRPDTKIVVVSTGFDSKLESFAANYDPAQTGALLSSLEITAMTTPNYSFFRSTSRSPVPRTDPRWNFRRILKACEDLSNAGIPVIPHLNAQTAKDWADWARFLRERPHMKYVAKEFQTGLKRQHSATDGLDNLKRLQDEVGRPLHPLLIGGVQHAARIARDFRHSTFVNSDPFMRTMHRRIIDLSYDISPKWITRLTEAAQPMDTALEFNVAHYAERLRRRCIPDQSVGPDRSFWDRVSASGLRGRQLEDSFERHRRGLAPTAHTGVPRPPLQACPSALPLFPTLEDEGCADAPSGGSRVARN